MLIVASFLFYGIGAAGVFKLRRQNPGGFRVPTVIPVLYCAFCATLVIVNLVQNPRDALIGFAIIAAGWPLLRSSRSEREAFD